jgi:hypothetical protein
MKSILTYALLLVCLSLNLNCATIVSGTTQEFTANSSPAGARILVNGEDKGMTPTTLTLPKSRTHQVVFRLDGHGDVMVNIDRKFDAGSALLGNLFSWGLIGLVVDLSNGSAYQLTPQQLNVTLRSMSSSIELNVKEDEIRVFFFTEDQVRAAMSSAR